MTSSTLFYVALFGVICLVLCDVDSTIQKGADTAKAGAHETESVFGPAAKGLEQSAHNIGSKFEHGFENLKSGINEKTAAARGSLGDTLRSGANKIDPSSHISGGASASSTGSHSQPVVNSDHIVYGIESTIQKGADSAKAAASGAKASAHDAVQGAKEAASNAGDKVQLGVNKVNEKTADARGALSEKMREGAHNIEPDHAV